MRPAPPRATTRRALRRPPERAGTHRRHAVAFVVRALRLALLFGLASEPRGVSLEGPARQEVPRVHELAGRYRVVRGDVRDAILGREARSVVVVHVEWSRLAREEVVGKSQKGVCSDGTL